MGLMKEILAQRYDGHGDRSFARIKSMFFDRMAVISMMDRRTRKALNRFGATCRKIAMNSIRSTTAVSTPGRPPSSHVGAKNRRIRSIYNAKGQTPPRLSRGIKEIYYSYDRRAESVVIGPIAFNSSELSQTAKELGPLNVLELLEYGGKAIRQVMQITDKATGERIWIHSKFLAPVVCTYKRRPFMVPAFHKAEEDLPKIWADASVL